MALLWLAVGLVVGLLAGWFGRGLAIGRRTPPAEIAIAAAVPATTAAAPLVADQAANRPRAGLEPVMEEEPAHDDAVTDDLEGKSRRLIEEMERRFGDRSGAPKRPEL